MHASSHRQHYTQLFLVAALGLALAACESASQESPVQTPPANSDIAAKQTQIETQCQDPRPEICTREYRPVCGLKDTGVRCVTTPCPATTEWKTYSTACVACSDVEVVGFVEGECERIN